MDAFFSILAPFFGVAAAEAAAAVAVFARISGAVFLLPGIGEQTVSMRVRLAIAIAMALIVYPAVRPETAPLWSGAAYAGVVGREAIVGIAIGVTFRIMIFVLQLAGTMIAQSTSISQQFGQSVASDTQTPISALLTLAGITLALSFGVHVEAVKTMIASYDQAALGDGLALRAYGVWLSEAGGGAFRLAVSMSGPFIALGIAYNVIIGAANRAMPQLMVAFVGAPAITGAGLLLLAMGIGYVLQRWREGSGDFLMFFGP